MSAAEAPCTCSVDDYDYARIDDINCPKHHPLPAAPTRDCSNCGNRAMDMDMEPYCAVVNRPWGVTLSRGKPVECGVESKLWTEDTRRKVG